MAPDHRPSNVEARKRAFRLAREAMSNTKINLRELADANDTDRHAISYAITILQHGNPEEIALAETGMTPLRQIYDVVSKRTPREDRLAKRKPIGVSQENLNQRRMESEVWQKLRDGLVSLNSLPTPKDTAAIVRKNPMRIEVVNRNLLAVITWIKDFEDEITK